MPPSRNKIFISYSHKDQKWKDLLVQFLTAYGEADEDQFEAWVDSRIELGDDWFPQIEQAMKEARTALLLLSVNFLNSKFIRKEELSTLLSRRKAEGLRVIPILVESCPWESWPSLQKIQAWPNPERPLSKMKGPEREEALTSLAKELAGVASKSGGMRTAQSSSGGGAWEPKVEALFRSTLCSNLENEDQAKAARRLLAYLRRETGLDAEDLFRAARFLVEYRLVMAEEAAQCSAGTDAEQLFSGGQEELRDALKDHIREASKAKAAPFLSPRVETTPGKFLERATERAVDWLDYFTALESAPIAGLAGKDVRTLSQIEIGGGALAPQYLLAGLMSHFHSEWKPVISGYTYPTRGPGGGGMLERLKASQWICWLVWGPSIPLCTCEHWQPLCAYQLGYGDENNSVPAYPAPQADSLREVFRDQARRGKHAMELDTVTGHLTWGPSVFADAAAFANAQARLTQPASDSAPQHAEEEATNGLLFELTGVRPREAGDDEPAYFTAYMWLMFWVARPGETGSLRGSLRLNGRGLPEVGDLDANRDRMKKERLWEDLLPVFVHANILDPVVLGTQKRMLVENAVQLLKRIWTENPALEFHLVCASDYTGCGCPVAFPSPTAETFVELLRARLKDLPEKDAAFGRSVRLPEADETAAARPMPYRAFFSACHLPEMIQGYYSWLRDLMKHLQKAGQ